jgi:hypothetical protein
MTSAPVTNAPMRGSPAAPPIALQREAVVLPGGPALRKAVRAVLGWTTSQPTGGSGHRRERGGHTAAWRPAISSPPPSGA